VAVAEPPAEPPPAEDEAIAADAGPPEPTPVVAAIDGGPPRDAADAVANAPRDGGPSGDAGPLAAQDGDAGPGGDAGPSLAGTEGAEPPPPPGAAADLRPFVPPGDKVIVLVRLDRLRGTPWEARAEAVLAPLPDHRSIMGGRAQTMASMFDVLVVSSSNPRDVAATNLAAKSAMAPAELEAFLAGGKQPVAWSTARGGRLGRRQPSSVKLARDQRVYLTPLPGWIVLAAPEHLGDLIQPAAGAPTAALPPWLDKLRDVAAEAGEPRGPMVVVSAGKIPKRISLLQFGEVPGPQRASVAIELVTGGFEARGTLRFADAALAATFEERFAVMRENMLSGPLGRGFLRGLHVYNALDGLSLRRRERDIAFATSMSGADAKALMELVADWARRYYELPPPVPAPTPAPAPAPAPAPTPTPAPKGTP
jgi:hypothetical protein